MDARDRELLLATVDRLDALVQNAKAVPLTDQVRIDREQIYDLLDQLRVIATAGEPRPPAPEPELEQWRAVAVAVDRIDALLFHSGRVDSGALTAALDELSRRVAALESLGVREPAPSELRTLADEVARRAGVPTSEREVRVDAQAFSNLVDAMRSVLAGVAWSPEDLDPSRR